MPTPDPYAAGGSDSPGPANSMPDQETAEPETADTADQKDETDTSGEEGQGEKNRLYLPEKFPMDKPPKEGDKKNFLVNAEYTKDDNGEMSWEMLTADGVPLDTNEEADEEEDKGDQGADEAAEGEAPENEPAAPATASTPNDVTKMILGK